MKVLHFTGQAVKPVPTELDEKILLKDVITSKECGTMSAGTLELKPGVSFDWTYVYDEVLYVIEGECQITAKGKTVNAKAGDVVFIGTGTEVTIGSSRGSKSLWVTHPNWLEIVDAAKRFKG